MTRILPPIDSPLGFVLWLATFIAFWPAALVWAGLWANRVCKETTDKEQTDD